MGPITPPKSEFTMNDALKVQKEQLKGWQKILKPEAFDKLQKHAEEKNKITKDPYKVFRGTDIHNFIHNNLIRE